MTVNPALVLPAEVAPDPHVDPTSSRVRVRRFPRSPKILVGLGVLAVFVVIAVIGPGIAPHDPGAISPNVTTGPSSQHWLGQTQLGQDIWSQLLVGTRPTLVVAFLAGAVATLLSIAIGITAGYVGGWADEVLSLLANVFLVLPALPLLIVVGSFMPKGDASGSLFIGTVIALTGWAWGARVLRAQSMSLRNRDFVEAARISGERTWRIIVFELVPNLVAVLASSFLFTVLYAIGTYVALGFLGVLNPAVNWSWGSILFDSTQGQAVASGEWWWYLPPGLCIALLGTSLALINFGVDEFINPRLRTAGVTRKAARRVGVRRSSFGFTPVIRGSVDVDGPDRSATATPHAAPSGPVEADLLLSIRGFSVDYLTATDPVHAVDGVDLQIHRGEVVGLAGESGSGKTTFAFGVSRLLRDPGVIVGGQAELSVLQRDGASGPTRSVDLLTSDRSVVRVVRWSEVAVVFQSALHALNPVMTIGRLIDDVLSAHPPHRSESARRARAAELLQLVGITPDRLDSYPHELSGGMRQRVMIAIALALQPQLLILDEPTTALDVVIQREILDEMMRLRVELDFAVLFITHDLSLLIEIADTIAVMYAGRIVEQAPARTLFERPLHPYTAGLLQSFPSLHGERTRLAGITGAPPDLRALPSGCPFHPRCPKALAVCSETRPPMVQATTDGVPSRAECWLLAEGVTSADDVTRLALVSSSTDELEEAR